MWTSVLNQAEFLLPRYRAFAAAQERKAVDQLPADLKRARGRITRGLGLGLDLKNRSKSSVRSRAGSRLANNIAQILNLAGQRSRFWLN